MSFLITLLYILFVLMAIVLVVVILLQEGKGGGFGDSLGVAGQQAFGVKATGVQRFTGYIAVAFLATAIAIHLLNRSAGASDSLGGDSLSGDDGGGAASTPAGDDETGGWLEGVTLTLPEQV